MNLESPFFNYKNSIIAGTVRIDKIVVIKTIFEARFTSNLYWAASKAVVVPAGIADMMASTPIKVSSKLINRLIKITLKGIAIKRIRV